VSSPVSGNVGSLTKWVSTTEIGNSGISENADGSVSISASQLQQGTAFFVNGGTIGIGGNGARTGVAGHSTIFGLSGEAVGPNDANNCCVTGVIGTATNPSGTGPVIGVGGYVNALNGWGAQGLNQGGGTGVVAQSQGGTG